MDFSIMAPKESMDSQKLTLYNAKKKATLISKKST